MLAQSIFIILTASSKIYKKPLPVNCLNPIVSGFNSLKYILLCQMFVQLQSLVSFYIQVLYAMHGIAVYSGVYICVWWQIYSILVLIWN